MPSSRIFAPSLIIGYMQRCRISSSEISRRSMPSLFEVWRISSVDLGIRDRRPTVLVPVPALAGLLTVAIHLVQLVRDVGVASLGLAAVLADLVADVDAGEVADRERPHREAELVDDAVDLLGQRALLDEEARLSRVGVERPVGRERVADADDHADLADPLGERHHGVERLGRGLLAAHDLEELHHVGRAEEVRARAPAPGVT